MEHVDCIVIGAGVVGLATARALARAGLEVIILESASAFGTGVSSRNSEVIHAGLYYPAGSLKARLCIRGKALLYDHCAERHVAHQRCGKLLVATRDQDVAQLAEFQRRAHGCGVHDLQWLTGDATRALEPELACAAALWSPSSGVVDSHGLMRSLLADAEQAGAILALHSRLHSARCEQSRWVTTTGDATTDPSPQDGFELAARWLVNCAGLHAQQVAKCMSGFPAQAIPLLHMAKGHYFSLAAKAPFSHLIYPLPVDGGLGVHLTLDLGGQAKFGPDVQWLTTHDPQDIDFQVDDRRKAGFEAEIRRYWPDLPQDALQSAYSGVRPKVSGPGQPAGDFRIDGPAEHGCAGVVQLFGIESPGLTACLAIAEHVANIICPATRSC